ncbi:MAG: hypothetical protein ONB44_05760 [candidate division KSB1 bacterium]|nr:hypothetical protein [candidate division KSB1 bacterium]MDZ7301632.1 hypothetical protein [candidate division KSB1 bacterium]MDZ7313507.1 hypothetical protein [candidate division KSB1 bacterium]
MARLLELVDGRHSHLQNRIREAELKNAANDNLGSRRQPIFSFIPGCADFKGWNNGSTA